MSSSLVYRCYICYTICRSHVNELLDCTLDYSYFCGVCEKEHLLKGISVNEKINEALEIDLMRRDLKNDIDKHSDDIIEQVDRTWEYLIRLSANCVRPEREIERSKEELDQIVYRFVTFDINVKRIVLTRTTKNHFLKTKVSV